MYCSVTPVDILLRFVLHYFLSLSEVREADQAGSKPGSRAQGRNFLWGRNPQKFFKANYVVYWAMGIVKHCLTLIVLYIN